MQLITVGAQAQSRNVLLIIADDFGIDVAEFYPTTAGRRVTTPPAPPMLNLRRLAQQGVLFRDTWANTECSPTRATIFTGRYSFRTGIGVYIRREPPGYPVLSSGEFSLPEAFKTRPDLGYMLAHIGKWHLSFEVDDPGLHGWPYSAGPKRSGALTDYFSWSKVVNGVTTTSTTYATTDQVNDALGVIQKAKTQGKPYFLWLAFNAPHSPYHKPPNDLHSLDSLPPYGPDMDRRPYYEAMAEAMDTEIGRLLKEVDLATTTVILVSDNGTPGAVVASPYSKDKAKSSIYQGGIHVPLLIAGAGVVDPGRVVEGLVNTVDLFPTILGLAGIDPRAVLPSGTKIDGMSLVPYVANTTGTTLRSWAYAERFHTSYTDQYARAIRNNTYKLIERADGSREFYDLAADPLETMNLLGRTLTDTQSSNLNILDGQLDALLATR